MEKPIVINEVSLDLLEGLGIDVPAKNRWQSIKAGISLFWLIEDAGLSLKQRKAIERHLRGGRLSFNYWNGLRKLRRYAKSLK